MTSPWLEFLETTTSAKGGTMPLQSLLVMPKQQHGESLAVCALNTFYLRLYGVRHMVKDHSDSEKGYSFQLTSRVLLYAPTDRITHTTAFVTPVVEHWLEREIAQWVHPMKDRSDDPSHHKRTVLPRSYSAKIKPWS